MVLMRQPSEMQTMNYRQLFNPTRWPYLKCNSRSALMVSRVPQLFDSGIISSGAYKSMEGLSFLNVCLWACGRNSLSLREEPPRGAGCLLCVILFDLQEKLTSSQGLSQPASYHCQHFQSKKKNDFGLLLQFLRSHEFSCCLMGFNNGESLVNYYWLPLKVIWSGIKAYWGPHSGCLKEGPRNPHVSFLSHHHHVASQMLVIKMIMFKDKGISWVFFYLSVVTWESWGKPFCNGYMEVVNKILKDASGGKATRGVNKRGVPSLTGTVGVESAKPF